MIVINFKNYKFAEDALALAKLIERYLPEAIVAVPVSEIKLISENTKLRVFAQHVDYFQKRATTGFTIVEDVLMNGGSGTILNHSEHQLTKETIERTMERCDEVGLDTLLCVESVKRAKEYLELKPDFMAFEDHELIGSGKSITEFRSKEVKKFSELLKRKHSMPLCGAGISTAADVRAATEFGCKGVLIASALAKVNLKSAEKLLSEIRDLDKA